MCIISLILANKSDNLDKTRSNLGFAIIQCSFDLSSVLSPLLGHDQRETVGGLTQNDGEVHDEEHLSQDDEQPATQELELRGLAVVCEDQGARDCQADDKLVEVF